MSLCLVFVVVWLRVVYSQAIDMPLLVLAAHVGGVVARAHDYKRVAVSKRAAEWSLIQL